MSLCTRFGDVTAECRTYYQKVAGSIRGRVAINKTSSWLLVGLLTASGQT